MLCPLRRPRAVPAVQVCSYRCIVSYESQLFTDFSLCVLQKHNCMGLTSHIPMVSHSGASPLLGFNSHTYRYGPMVYYPSFRHSPSGACAR